MGAGLGENAEKGAASAQKAMIKSDESQNALVLIAEPAQVRNIESTCVSSWTSRARKC